MRQQGDRAFTLGTALLVLIVVGLTLLYPPVAESAAHRWAPLAILIIVALTRFVGVVAGVAAGALVGLALALTWGVGGPGVSPDIDALFDAVTFVAATVVLVIYIGSMRRSQRLVAEHEQAATVLAQLSLDLLPPTLGADDMKRFKARLTQIILAEEVQLLAPRPDGSLECWIEAADCCASISPERRRVARLVYEAAIDRTSAERHAGRDEIGDADRAASGGLYAASQIYLPITSASGVEGVLFVQLRTDSGADSQVVDESFLGFVTGLVGSLMERARLQDAMSKARAIEEADRLKANIVSSVSHDLKTPLAEAMATLSGVTGQLRRGEEALNLPVELDSVRNSLLRLDQRIGELIDISRLEAADWKVNLDWNDTRDIYHLARTRIGESGSRLHPRFPAEPLVARFDLAQMSRALYHLIENALLYSPPDSEVTVGASSAGGSLRVWVEDRGPGIDPAEHDAIFEKFQRGRAGGSVPGGTGLGLSVAAGIAAVHGGHVDVENVHPSGARFTIVIPAESEESE